MLRFALLIVALLCPSIADAFEIVDRAGRTIVLDGPARSIAIGDGRILPAIAMLDRADPLARVAVLLTDLKRTDPDLLGVLQAGYPKMSSLPVIAGNSTSVSAETIITLAPDVAIFGLSDHGPGANNRELIGQLAAAGITVVFIDFRSDPLNNTIPSIELLGKILGREAEARDFIDFYSEKRARISARLETYQGEKPSVFLQAHVGRMPCCVGMANGMLGPFIEFAGGQNISAEVSPGIVGRHTLEFLLAENPDVWIGTASGRRLDFEQGRPMIVLGAGVDENTGTESLIEAATAGELVDLGAFQNGRAYGIWHNFYNSPFNIYALEAFAKWIHPELFADVDPDQTLQEIYTRFLPFDLQGAYSASYKP